MQGQVELDGRALGDPAFGPPASAAAGGSESLRPTDSLAARLLRRVFSGFFAVTSLLLVIQLTLDYRHTRRRLTEDLVALGGTFGPGIADAMWGLNDDVLHGILTGMQRLPEVVGVAIFDESGRRLQTVGTVPQNMASATAGLPSAADAVDTSISQTFDITHRGARGDPQLIGHWTVYSSRWLVLKEVQSQFYLLATIALIKTAALWFIFLAVIRRAIGRPLRELSSYVAQINVDNLGDRPFVLHDRGRHELHILAETLNRMAWKIRASLQDNTRLLEDLQTLNATLQARVEERTKELERLATTDDLTGLANRRKLDEVLAQEMRRVERFSEKLSVILIDIDHFKSVNDTHGHHVGDLVLVVVATVIAQTVRAVDTAGRWGGEEFMVICPNTELADAMLLAERLRTLVAAADLPVIGSKTCSFGVAQLGDPETTEEMIARADAALYGAKQAGRNRVLAAAEAAGQVQAPKD
jgi:diguanylate cyclase (GGDEF)-like protein